MIGQRSANGHRDFSQVALPAAAAASAASARGKSEHSKQADAFPFVLVGLVALYLVYAVVEQHEKLSRAIEPKNIGINLRNIAVILVPVILGLNLLKILGVKLVAWGVPGAKLFLQIVAGA